jgi:hypothetical protein
VSPFIYGGRYTLFCRELSVQVTFLHATRIDPNPMQTIDDSLLSTKCDFCVTLLCICGNCLHILEGDLILAPGMRKNGIRWDFVIGEFPKFQGG